MKNSLRLNKKAVSLMIGYVLLIAIAVALATAVFFYLKLYLPDERAECDADIKIAIDELACKISTGSGRPTPTVYINFTNKGFFTIDNVFIKIGEADRVLKKNLHDPERMQLDSDCNYPDTNLKPDKKYCGVYNPTFPLNGVQEVSVEPVIWVDNKPVLCPDAVVSKKVVCI